MTQTMTDRRHELGAGLKRTKTTLELQAGDRFMYESSAVEVVRAIRVLHDPPGKMSGIKLELRALGTDKVFEEELGDWSVELIDRSARELAGALEPTLAALDAEVRAWRLLNQPALADGAAHAIERMRETLKEHCR